MKAISIICLFVFIPTWLIAKEIESVLLHPIYDQYYSCVEHWADQLPSMGDALGTDCTIQKLTGINGRTWLRSYVNEGAENADWYGWQQNVLAPTSGVVEKINLNANDNKPGIIGSGIAAYIIIKRTDGIRILLAHVGQITVKEGDSVSEGDVIAKVGNNGQSRHPHIHIGAWKNKEALQIRFDQKNIKGL